MDRMIWRPENVQANGLCIGCGFCAAVCPSRSIAMRWSAARTWVLDVAEAACTGCGLCVRVCPNTPDCLGRFGRRMAESGERFGLTDPAGSTFNVVIEPRDETRLKSASGGAVIALLGQLMRRFSDRIVSCKWVSGHPTQKNWRPGRRPMLFW